MGQPDFGVGMPDMTKYLFQGLEEAKKQREKRDKSKAMKDLLSSVSTLFPDINAQSFSPGAAPEPTGPPAPTPATPVIPQGAPVQTAPPQGAVGMPAPPPGMFKTPEEAAKAFQAGQAAVASGAVAPPPGAPAPGVTAPAGQAGPAVTPPAPGPGMLNLQPPPSAGPISPRISVPEPGTPDHAKAVSVGKAALDNATPDMRRQLLTMMSNAGDYVPEAVDTIHKMFSGEPFKEQDKMFNHPPGSVVTDKHGKVLLKVPDREQKPSFGVSERGWLTTVHADGTVEEHVGVKPMQTSVEALKQSGATLRGDAANTARIRAAEIAAQGGIDRVSMAAKYAKDLTRFKLDKKAAQDPKTIGAYYVKLLQSYQAGEATEDDITMMEYVRPIVEKQGLLPMLLQGGGEMPAATPPPWKPGDAAPAPAAAPEKKGLWNSLFGGKPEAGAPPVPTPIAKTPKGPPRNPAKAPGADGPGFSISGQKLTAPGGFSDADIQMTMTSMQKKLKEGYSKDQLVEHLRKKGWMVQ